MTVTYVNWVFKSHEAKKWEETDRRISGRLEIITNTYITALRSSFSLDFIIFDENIIKGEDRVFMHSELLKVAKNVLSPIIFDKLLYLNAEKWKFLMSEFKDILDQIDRVFLYYGNKLSPKKYSLLLDIQEELEDIIKEYKAIPGIFDEPDPTRDVDKYLKAIIADKITRVMDLLIKLEQLNRGV